jgi:hypothetical protein
MRRFHYLMTVTACALGTLCAAPALAQSLPGMGGANALTGAASGMMGGGGMGGMGLPSLSSSSTDNVAGVLSYCVKNKIVQGGAATSALSALSGKDGVTSSSGYLAGEKGDIQSSNGSSFSLDGVSQQMKTKGCDMVLQHAQSLL